MTQIDFESTVGQLVIERPGRARVFERFGIDYCCGGKRALDEACRARQLDPQSVATALRQSDEAAESRDETNWAAEPLDGLIANILDTHHAYLRRELPRLTQLVTKVRDVHGARHPELVEVADVFAGLRAELQAHMMKEEQILFPFISALAAGDSGPGHCGSVQNPIRVMEHEHDSAGAALARMRELTGDYATPADACNTYRALLGGLADLEADLHLHIHKENNILFPRAVELERTVASSFDTDRCE